MYVLIKAHRDSCLELLGDIVHLGVQNPVKLALQGRHLLRGHGTHCSNAQSSDPRHGDQFYGKNTENKAS